VTARESIENLWDRATPVAPLLTAYRAEIVSDNAKWLDSVGEHDAATLLGAVAADLNGAAGPAPATDRAALRDLIAAAIRDAACNGDCDDTEEQCARTRIQPFVWHHGVLAEVSGPVDVIADAVLAGLPASLDRADVLREAAAAIDAAFTGRDLDRYTRYGADLLRRMADETPQHTEAVDLPTLAAALDGIHGLIATSSRDWGTYRVDAWLWAVLCGWDCEEQHEHDELCDDGGAMREMAEQHGWDDDTVAKARRYRAAVRVITEPAPAAPAQPAEPPQPETPVHAVPVSGSNGISSCCGRPPCEFVGERVTRDPNAVTCQGAPAVVAQPDGEA
jgi:hypothetical protein